VWNITNLSGFKLARIRVQNTASRQYLNAYESLRFSREITYSYLIDYVDEISEETFIGYYDLSRFLEEFYEEDDQILEASFPVTYHWDLDESDPLLGVLFPYAYHSIFIDQFEYNNYYYYTDELARNYKIMALYKPYNMTANGYKWLVYEADNDMSWYTSLLLTTLGSDSDLKLKDFNDGESARTWGITSFFDRELYFPATTLLDDFIDDRSVDLSLLSLKNDSHFIGLTTYSIDNQSDFFLSITRNAINPQKFDSEFPSFIGAKFRRV
jgi:hypothetical protein